MYTLGAGRILIKSNIIVCLLNLMARKASWAHRTDENEKKDNDKIKKSVQTSSACAPINICKNFTKIIASEWAVASYRPLCCAQTVALDSLVIPDINYKLNFLMIQTVYVCLNDNPGFLKHETKTTTKTNNKNSNIYESWF